MTDNTTAPMQTSAAPPKDTEVGSHHLLSYHGASGPSEYIWSGTGWQTLPGGCGSKPQGMTLLGWRYVGPARTMTPEMKERLLDAARGKRAIAALFIAAAEKLEAAIHG